MALPINKYPIGYIFYSLEYTTININFIFKEIKLSIYFNSGCSIILGDREFLRKYIPEFKLKIKYIPSYILVCGFSNKVSATTEFLDINIYIDNINS